MSTVNRVLQLEGGNGRGGLADDLGRGHVD